MNFCAIGLISHWDLMRSRKTSPLPPPFREGILATKWEDISPSREHSHNINITLHRSRLSTATPRHGAINTLTPRGSHKSHVSRSPPKKINVCAQGYFLVPRNPSSCHVLLCGSQARRTLYTPACPQVTIHSAFQHAPGPPILA